MTDQFQHLPVLLEEVAAAVHPVPPGTIVDATLGGGGHAARLLRDRPDCRLVGIDRDPRAIEAARDRLAPFEGRFDLVHGRFVDLATIMTDLRVHDVSAVLFDLGVSSPQFDEADRGFSYRFDGPVDMRMDPTQTWTAADVVNGYGVEALAEMLRVNGDERFAGRIARAIVAQRPIESTAQLAEVVREAIPAAARRRGGHPAKRTFQAIRIEVNDELAQLPSAIDDAIETALEGGRVIAISYHSGEDRIVKARMRQAASGGCSCPPQLPCVCDAVQTVRLLRPGGITPQPGELAANPRAASARLRIAEKIAPTRRVG